MGHGSIYWCHYQLATEDINPTGPLSIRDRSCRSHGSNMHSHRIQAGGKRLRDACSPLRRLPSPPPQSLPNSEHLDQSISKASLPLPLCGSLSTARIFSTSHCCVATDLRDQPHDFSLPTFRVTIPSHHIDTLRLTLLTTVSYPSTSYHYITPSPSILQTSSERSSPLSRLLDSLPLSLTQQRDSPWFDLDHFRSRFEYLSDDCKASDTFRT